MSTVHSRHAYSRHIESGERTKKEGEITAMFREAGRDGLTISEVCDLYRKKHPHLIRDISGVVCTMHTNGQLNRDDVNTRFNPDTGSEASVYFLPTKKNNKAQRMKRKYKKALADAERAKEKAEALYEALEERSQTHPDEFKAVEEKRLQFS